MMRFLIFGMLGVFGSVVESCVESIAATRRIELTGSASLILFPFWGLIALLYPLAAMNLGSLPWYWRGAALAGILIVIKGIVGALLRRANLCPWSYSGPTQLFGLVRLADIPTFFIAGLLIERIYPLVKAAAAAM